MYRFLSDKTNQLFKRFMYPMDYLSDDEYHDLALGLLNAYREDLLIEFEKHKIVKSISFYGAWVNFLDQHYEYIKEVIPTVEGIEETSRTYRWWRDLAPYLIGVQSTFYPLRRGIVWGIVFKLAVGTTFYTKYYWEKREMQRKVTDMVGKLKMIKEIDFKKMMPTLEEVYEDLKSPLTPDDPNVLDLHKELKRTRRAAYGHF